MQLTPEQINDFIAKSVLDSQIGTAVKESVERVMKDTLSKTYNNPFDTVINRHVIDLLDGMLKQNYEEELKTRLRDRLAEAFSDEVFDRIITAALERFSRNY